MGTAIRLSVMLVALALLLWLLNSRYQADREQKTLADQAQAARLAAPVEFDGFVLNKGIGELGQPFLLEAQQARAEIAALCQQRRKEIFWPDLIVPVKVNARTQSQLYEDYLRFRLREYQAYCQFTNDEGDARIQGEAFLDAYIRNMAAPEHVRRDYEKLFHLGKSAIDAGSQDPMLRTYYAMIMATVEQKRAEAEAIWREALNELPQTRYPRIVQVYARCFLHESVNVNETQEAAARWKQASVTIVRWLEEETQNPEWLGSVCHRLTNVWSKLTSLEREVLLGFVFQSKAIDPYFAHELAGEYYAQQAWNSRGMNSIDQVPPRQLADFEESYRIAVDHLLYAWKLHPELPYASQQMISAAMSGAIRTETAYFWFVQSIDAQFDFYPAYDSFIYSLMPRWGGNHQDMLQFARNCLNTKRFETYVPYMVINILELFTVKEEWSINEHPKAKQLVRDLAEARETYRQEHPDAVLAEKGSFYPAKLAVQLDECELFDEASILFESAYDDLQWIYLQQEARAGRYLAARQIAAWGDLRAPIVAFDQKLRSPWDVSKGPDQVAELVTEYHRLKELALLKTEASDKYFKHVEVMLEQLRLFSSGESAPLELDSNLSGWEPYADNWWRTDEGQIQMTGRRRISPRTSLRPLVNFSPPLEFEGNLELLDPEPYFYRAGVGWSREGMTNYSDSTPSLPLFAIRASNEAIQPFQPPQRRDIAWVVTGFDTSTGTFPLVTSGAHRLRLKLWSHTAEYRVDDQILFKVDLPDGLHPEGWFCLGENAPIQMEHRSVAGGSLQISDLRVQRLKIPPPPRGEVSLEERAEYWEQRYALDPDDAAAVEGLCAIRYEQGRDDESLAMADQALAKWPLINGIHYWKALVLFDHRQDYKAADEELRIVLKEPRDNPEASARMIEIEAAAPDESLRNVESAKQHAELIVRLTNGPHARSLAALAVVRAAMGDFEQAIKLQQSALTLAKETEKPAWEERLQLYENHQPFRLPSRESSP